MTDDPGTEGNASEVDDLSGLADLTAAEASAFLTSVTEVASGSSPDTALPILTLALSQVLVAGSRLGAIQDVVPEERFEPDAADDDADPLRTGLANVFAGIDDYVYVIDPITSSERADGSITNDLVDVAVALTHGLKHYASRPQGRGALVVAVQLPLRLGRPGDDRAARPPVDPRAPAARRRRGGRRRGGVRRAAPVGRATTSGVRGRIRAHLTIATSRWTPGARA